MSDDGKKVLFRERVGDGSVAYIRATDGTSPIKLGPGWPLAMSPDEKWALVVPDAFNKSLSLLPIGTGAGRTVPFPFVNIGRGRWLQDNRRIVMMAQPPKDEQMSLYVIPLEGGPPRQIAPAVTPYYFEVSRDDRLAAARALDGFVTLYPVEGGDPIALAELGSNAVPIGWSNDGDLWVRELGEVPSRLVRFNLKRRRVVEERRVGPSDSTGVSRIKHVQITPDGQAVAFDYGRSLDRLLLIDGLVPEH